MSNDHWVIAIKRFVNHLPKSNEDKTLVILKAHLLIEALLREIIDQRLAKPKALEKASFEFFQCICLAEAMYADSTPEWLWSALRKLNIIRNKLAHNFAPAGIEDKTKDFITYVEGHRDKQTSLRSFAKDSPLNLALGDIHSQLLMLIPQVEQEA